MFRNFLGIIILVNLASCSTNIKNTIPKEIIYARKVIAGENLSKELTVNSKLAFYDQASTGSIASGGYLTLINGVLKVTDSCVVIDLENGASVQPIFTSSSVSWDNDRSILSYHGKKYSSGDYIELGGGFVSENTIKPLLNKNIPTCRNSKLFLANS